MLDAVFSRRLDRLFAEPAAGDLVVAGTGTVARSSLNSDLVGLLSRM